MEARNSETMPFKVFGLQRTGTNLMQALMQKNFQVRYLSEASTGWKHGAPQPACFIDGGSKTRFVFCVKNPYAWLVSCYRYFCRAHTTDQTVAPDFKRDPSMSFAEFVCSPSYEFQTPVHRWNFMNRCWLTTLPEQRLVVVQQERQLDSVSQVQILERIEQKFRPRRQSKTLQGIDQQVDVNASLQGAANREHYVLRHYMIEYPPALLDMVNEVIDPDLMDYFGYQDEQWGLVLRKIGGQSILVRHGTADGRRAHALATDPYQLTQLQLAEPDLTNVLDIGSGIGLTVMAIKRLWPKAKITAYEPALEHFRMLRLNTRVLTDVELFPEWVVSGALSGVGAVDSPADSLESDDAQETGRQVSFDQVTARLGARIDLLMLGSSRVAASVLCSTASSTLLQCCRRLLGVLPSDAEARRRVTDTLSETHSVTSHPSAIGDCFAAVRKS
jgi:hypothetical protein